MTFVIVDADAENDTPERRAGDEPPLTAVRLPATLPLDRIRPLADADSLVEHYAKLALRTHLVAGTEAVSLRR
jgi:hypothetical protein